MLVIVVRLYFTLDLQLTLASKENCFASIAGFHWFSCLQLVASASVPVAMRPTAAPVGPCGLSVFVKWKTTLPNHRRR